MLAKMTAKNQLTLPKAARAQPRRIAVESAA